MEESEFDMASKMEFFAWKYPDIAPLVEQIISAETGWTIRL